MHIINNLAEHPVVYLILSVSLFLFSSLTCYLLLNGLLKMHRSKTAVKKLKKEYTFLQKLWLCPFKIHCLHAVKFCKFLVILQRIGWIYLALYLLISSFSSTVLVWGAVILFVLFDLPVFLLHFALVRPIIFGRLKHYSFEKYHNTENHISLL